MVSAVRKILFALAVASTHPSQRTHCSAFLTIPRGHHLQMPRLRETTRSSSVHGTEEPTSKSTRNANDQVAARATAAAANGGKYRIRTSKDEDYQRVISSVDDWWSGRSVSPMLPRLFFEHFCDTSFVVELSSLVVQEIDQKEQATSEPHVSPVPTEDERRVVGFLCGFISQARAGEAHCHFIGVDPAHRGAGLGHLLYQHFFDAVKARGCTMVHAVTHPGNAASVAFHHKLGFLPRPTNHSNRTVTDMVEVPVFDGAESDGTKTPMSLVHIGWDGPVSGDRVLLDKQL